MSSNETISARADETANARANANVPTCLPGLFEEAGTLQEELSTWRRALHHMPEVGLHLPQSAAYIKAQLEAMDIAYDDSLVEGSCITAVLGAGDPCFLLRADYDALPIPEQSGEPFAATNGCMHACGHDMHAAMLLGAAKLLKRHEHELKGSVKLLFQPGEEAAGGAAACVAEGALENPRPDAAFAMHVFSQAPLGSMAWGEQAMARVHNFQITVEGSGGHGSMPERCIDPITPAAYIHLGMQELISREIAGTDEAVLTTGALLAGSGSNIIPQTAVLKANMRTFSDAIHDRLYSRINDIAQGIATTYRATATVETIEDDPALVCDRALSELVSATIRATVPNALVADNKLHLMGSEDFSFIAREIPSTYIFASAPAAHLGARRTAPASSSPYALSISFAAVTDASWTCHALVSHTAHDKAVRATSPWSSHERAPRPTPRLPAPTHHRRPDRDITCTHAVRPACTQVLLRRAHAPWTWARPLRAGLCDPGQQRHHCGPGPHARCRSKQRRHLSHRRLSRHSGDRSPFDACCRMAPRRGARSLSD